MQPLQPLESGTLGGAATRIPTLAFMVEQQRLRLDHLAQTQLAELLALHNVVDLSFPRQYSVRVRNALDAQAKSVRLRDLNAWWYAVGIRLSAL